MNWQNIIVYVIGAAVFAWLVRAAVRSVRTRKYTKCDACGDAVCPYRVRKKRGRPPLSDLPSPFQNACRYNTVRISSCAVSTRRNITTG